MLRVFRTPSKGSSGGNFCKCRFWQQTAVVLVVALALPISRPQSLPEGFRPIQQSALGKLLEEGNAQFAGSHFETARDFYKRGLRKAEVSGSDLSRARFLVGIANCDLKAQRYASAIQHYSEAGRFALRRADWSLAGVSAFNRYLAYSRMGDKESASIALRDGVRFLSGGAETNVPGRVLVELARAGGSDGVTGAEALFHKALRALEDQGNVRHLKYGWIQYGRFLLDRDRPQQAELAFREALRLAASSAERVVILYGLAEVDRRAGRLKQSLVRNESASRLLRNATTAELPEWMLLQQRAQLLAHVGRSSEALAAFEDALKAAAEFRSSVRWNTNAGLAGERFLHQLYSNYLNFVLELPSTPQYNAVRRRALLFSEYSKALTLSEQLQSSPPQRVDFENAITELRKAETKVLGTSSPDLDSLSQSQLKIRQLEVVLSSTSGIQPKERKGENNSSGFSLPYIQRELGDHQVLFSFHTSARSSTVWAVTRNTVEVSSFVGQSQLGSQVRGFTDAIRARNPEAIRSRGRELYRQIFGSFSKDVLATPHWILSVDQQLFELPYAALTTDLDQFLIEQHSVRLIAGARLLLTKPREQAPARLVAYGDPVYNAADARHSVPRPWPFRLLDFFSAARRDTLELPRLPGSAAEAYLTAGAVPQFQNVVLTGNAASRPQLIRSISKGAGIFHFAGHVVQSEQRPELVMMALGLDAVGRQDFLSPSEVASQRFPLGLVVLSGCGSGRGKTLPGAGLLGMTRSWLIAGAQAVTAALWPTTDDVGEFFRLFYSSLMRDASVAAAKVTSARAAEALQQAQVGMLRSKSWRSAPDYWAPYVVLGRD